MRRLTLAWLALLLPCIRAAHGQTTSAQSVPGTTPLTEPPPVALPWAVAALCTIVVLLIVCMPSRKA